MGWTWEVERYVKISIRQGIPTYAYETIWTGESFVRALLETRKAKKTCGAVRLTWRG